LIVTPFNAYRVNIPINFFDKQNLFVSPPVSAFMAGGIKIIHNIGDKRKILRLYIFLPPQGFPMTVFLFYMPGIAIGDKNRFNILV
jgi:hypothetical protein